MKVIFATGNEGKLKEVRKILGPDYEVITMREAGFTGEIVEDGKTFEENAVIKVKAIGPREDAIIMADDSGIEIKAFDYGPGVYSARFMGLETPYTVRNQVIIDRLKGLEGEERYARFTCVIAALFPDGTIKAETDHIEGQIAHEPAGENGFGYDPIFWLPEKGKTTAELKDEAKNSISHRGKALRKMSVQIEEWVKANEAVSGQ